MSAHVDMDGKGPASNGPADMAAIGVARQGQARRTGLGVDWHVVARRTRHGELRRGTDRRGKADEGW